MATFTSAQDGDWNDGATWGNTSPGVKGTDWPGLAGDVTNIGHEVDYNVSETNELGTMTLTSGGVLKFNDSADRKLTFGHSNLDIESAGRLGAGGSGATPFDKSHKLEIYWNTTANATRGIQCASGGKVDLQDDPDYYGDEPYTSLAADGDGTTSITTSDSRAWNVGDQIMIHTGDVCTGFNGYKNDWILTSIAAISGTSITCADTVSSAFKSGGLIAHLTRNVIIGKLGHPEVLGSYGSNRPEIDSNTDYANFCLRARFIGVDRISLDDGRIGGVFFGALRQFNRSNNTKVCGIFANCSRAFEQAEHINAATSDCLACYEVFGTRVYDATIQDAIGCCYISDACTYLKLRDMVSCCYLSGSISAKMEITGSAYLNFSAIGGVACVTVEGNIGYTPTGILKANNYDFKFPTTGKINNSLMPTSPVFSGRNTHGYPGYIRSENHNQVAGAQYTFDAFGDVIKEAADGTGDNPSQRPGGCSNVIEVVPQSNCDDDAVLEIFGFDEVFIYQDVTTAKTYRVYIQTDFVTLPAEELVLTARYPSSAITGATTDVDSVGGVSTRTTQGDWSQYLEVSVTPSRVGLVEFRLELRGYEAGKKVWVDPTISVS